MYYNYVYVMIDLLCSAVVWGQTYVTDPKSRVERLAEPSIIVIEQFYFTIKKIYKRKY